MTLDVASTGRAPVDRAVRIRSRVDLVVLTQQKPPEPVVSDTAGLGGLFGGGGPDLGFGLPELKAPALPMFDESVPGVPDVGLQRPGLLGGAGPVDVFQGSGTTAVLQGLLPRSSTWKRNPPAIPDELTFEIDASTLPVDDRVLRGSQVAFWLFNHENYQEPLGDRAGRCQHGDPGYFGGVVETVDTSTDGRRKTFRCLDFTVLPLKTRLDFDQLKEISLEQPLDLIVGAMLDTMPGGEQWIVDGRGSLSGTSPGVVLADEKTVRVGAREEIDFTRQVKTPERVAADAIVEGTGVSGYDIRTQYNLKDVLRSHDLDVETVAALVDGDREGIVGGPSGFTNPTVYIPARVYTKRVVPTWEEVLGPTQWLWDGIVRLCHLMGTVPEVAVTETGQVACVIVDAAEMQRGDVLRRFRRDGRTHRVMTWGRDVFSLGTHRELVGGTRVDYVDVRSVDPDTGKCRRERYGRKQKNGATKLHGVSLNAHGIADSAHLQRLAERAFINVNSGEYSVSVVTKDPWSTGGSPADPDLLNLGPGARTELDFEAARKASGSLQEVLQRQGVPAAAAATLATASAELAPSLIFQVLEVTHVNSSANNGNYACSIALQTFLDDGASHGSLELEDIE